MSRTLATLLLASSLLTPLGGKAHRVTEQGNRLFHDGELDDALRAYTEAQVIAPEAPQLYYDIGNVLYRQGDYEGAAEAFTQALLAAPDELRSAAAFNLGNARFQQEEYDQAVEAYVRALEARPDDRDAKRNLELAYRALEQQPPPEDGEPSDESSEGRMMGPAGLRATKVSRARRRRSRGARKKTASPGSEPDPSKEGDANPKPAPEGMTKEQAERLLDALAAAERQNLDEEEAVRAPGEKTREKDW